MRSVLAVVLVGGLTSATHAQDALAATQKRAYIALQEVHEAGRAVYNQGDFGGGYRLYQGGLIAVQYMLAARPELQKMVSDGLASAARLSTAEARGFRLHEVIEAVRTELEKAPP